MGLTPERTPERIKESPHSGSDQLLADLTLLANCRAQRSAPEGYLIEVLKRMPHGAAQEEASALTPARIAAERRAKAEAEQSA